MKDIRLDENWDLIRAKGDISFIEGSEETAQNVNIRILNIRGEYIFNQTLGVPWFDGMLGSGYLRVERDFELRNAILKTKGVEKINSYLFKIDADARTAFVQYSIETKYGTTEGYIDEHL